MHPTRRPLLAGIAAAFALPARAQTAGGPIRIIVPYPPGGPADVSARILAEGLQAALMRTFVVENRTGAGGNIGMDLVAKSTPDGTVLGLAAASNLTTNQFLFDAMPFDPLADLAPVAMLAEVHNLLVVHPRIPVRTLDELVAWARANPNAATYGSPAVGSQGHLGLELLRRRLDFPLTHVPYRGAAPAVTDLAAGTIALMLAQESAVKPLVEDGRLRALGVASGAPSPSSPGIAPLLPGFEAVSWYGFVVPAATPRPIVEALAEATRAVLNLPTTRERFASLGLVPVFQGPDAFAARARAEAAVWGPLIRSSGITIQ